MGELIRHIEAQALAQADGSVGGGGGGWGNSVVQVVFSRSPGSAEWQRCWWPGGVRLRSWSWRGSGDFKKKKQS